MPEGTVLGTGPESSAPRAAAAFGGTCLRRVGAEGGQGREVEAADGGRVLRPLLRRAGRARQRPPRPDGIDPPGRRRRVTAARAGRAADGGAPRRREQGGRMKQACRSWTSRRRYAPPVKGRPAVPIPSAWVCTATWQTRLPLCRPRGRTRI